MTFPLKTLRMKRKSFDISWEWNLILCGILALLIILTFALRTVLMPSKYGGVTIEIPTINMPVRDEKFHSFSEKSIHTIKKTTPLVVLTSTGFYFGPLESFSNKVKSEERFLVRHQDGHPMLGNLIFQLDKWTKYRSKNANIPNEKILIVIPASEMPLPIITQVVNEIKKSKIFEKVILGGGIQ